MIVYIASPYTKGDIEANVRKSIEYADTLCSIPGVVPLVPLLTHLWHTVSPKPVEFWYEYDLHFLDFCDALIRFPGESSGADREVEVAKKKFIPVYYGLNDFLTRDLTN